MRAGGSVVDGRHVAIGAAEYVVFDLETTGLFPGANDRIIEVATLRMSVDGRVLDEWSTLINPGRDLGATHIHGVSAQEVADAPEFRELIGDLSQRLAGAVLVAHNVQFDLGFLSCEFARSGCSWPRVAALCTMTLPGRLGLRLPGRSLAAACGHFGIAWNEGRAHNALADARATGELLTCLLNAASSGGARTLADLGCVTAPAPTAAWPSRPSCGRTQTRNDAARAAGGRFGFLSTVAQRAASRSGAGGELAPYLDLLDRVLEDHSVMGNERDLLGATAAEWGLSDEQIVQAHRDYLDALVEAAWADGVVAEAERRELVTIGFWLGVDQAEVSRLVGASRSSTGGEPPRNGRSLAGLSVCFTGQLTCSQGGRAITRTTAHLLATQAGLTVMDQVTKRLDLLVVADPHTQSGKARKAREYGTRVLAEQAFWRLLGIRVD